MSGGDNKRESHTPIVGQLLKAPSPSLLPSSLPLRRTFSHSRQHHYPLSSAPAGGHCIDIDPTTRVRIESSSRSHRCCLVPAAPSRTSLFFRFLLLSSTFSPFATCCSFSHFDSGIRFPPVSVSYPVHLDDDPLRKSRNHQTLAFDGFTLPSTALSAIGRSSHSSKCFVPL